MTTNDFLQTGLFLLVLLLLVKPVGSYMALVFADAPNRITRFGGRVERGIYRLCGISSSDEMGWKRYALAMLLFNVLGLLAVYALQRTQPWLPLNPQHFAAVAPDSAMNTAISFASNTNWQGYAGESTMSYLTQMLGLAVQNFLSAATGIAVLVAVVRGFSRRSALSIGNFWVDLTRSTLYVLLPLSLLMSLLLVSQGVVQNFRPYVDVPVLQAGSYSTIAEDAAGHDVGTQAAVTTQTLPMGPAASQVAIKLLGTNGGGFFNANSAHPYENPTPFSNFIEMLAIFLIPGGLCVMFGRMVGDRRQGRAILATMLLIFVPLAIGLVAAEQAGNPALHGLAVDAHASALQAGGNMEGKETRFGIASSGLFAAITTAASCGAVNAMHDSLTPLGGLVPMWLMQLGEVIFGGVGSGLYGMLAFAVVAVFIAGLMVGRTPEYLGKKIEAHEMKMASLAVLLPCALVVIGTAIAVTLPAGAAGVANPGAHGFSEMLYAVSSASNNNGSAFGGLSANTPFWNVLLGACMFLARFPLAIAMLAMAGSLAAKRHVPESAGTLPTHTPLFVALLACVVIVVGALTFLPALALGPIAESLMSGH
ncbi:MULTISPECIES: potassium-transporting ATPase subunit KdpA [unclassified Rhodanobacter]|uniref:potassium-transporting ATPase subunit KdpA n=1 Tax=unclassified Rhodanobacter TaxID=2621553 RepID=UPI001BDFDA96|nr:MULTISPECIES: potassium-transporting ATPase subunit KdpA [unclassified Rhodanobacter]MBT2145554.1 potassium-transporting ATPase subunit KdpA [Rhodanobacter sp. LX-99]MBT2149599.1 potassium-transporting ATPase subunit KdpA [Rhodanobacter sp. LX-100]